jgi:hypothetical protein
MWKQLDKFPGYSVSDEGQVRNDRTGHILKPQLNTSGYPMAALPTERGWRTFSIHRLVAFAFLPPPLPGQNEVAHNDGTRTNNRATNLRWATKTENQRDRLLHGTHGRGERGTRAKFTNAEAALLRAFMRANPRVKNTELARQHGVSHETIRALRKGETYQEAV